MSNCHHHFLWNRYHNQLHILAFLEKIKSAYRLSFDLAADNNHNILVHIFDTEFTVVDFYLECNNNTHHIMGLINSILTWGKNPAFAEAMTQNFNTFSIFACLYFFIFSEPEGFRCPLAFFYNPTPFFQNQFGQAYS